MTGIINFKEEGLDEKITINFVVYLSDSWLDCM